MGTREPSGVLEQSVTAKSEWRWLDGGHARVLGRLSPFQRGVTVGFLGVGAFSVQGPPRQHPWPPPTGVWSSTPDPNPLDARSTPSRDNHRCPQTWPGVPQRQSHPIVRSTNSEDWGVKQPNPALAGQAAMGPIWTQFPQLQNGHMNVTCNSGWSEGSTQ